MRGSARFFPWIFDGADPTERTAVLSMPPPPVRVLCKLAWGPRYQRQVATLWSETPCPATSARALLLARRRPWPTGVGHAFWMSTLATYELDGHIATITYNRPESLNTIKRRCAATSTTPSPASEMKRTPGSRSSPARAAFCAGADMRDGGGSAGEFGGHVLGEAHHQLVRERLGDLQAGDRRGQRLLPRLRAHPGDVVRLRDRQRPGGVRVPRGPSRVPTIVGAIRLPQRVNWQYAMELLLTGERISGAGQGDRPCRLGGAPRPAHGRGAGTGRPVARRRPFGRPGDQGGGGAFPVWPPWTPSGSVRPCASSLRHRGRPRGSTCQSGGREPRVAGPLTAAGGRTGAGDPMPPERRPDDSLDL